MLNELAKYRNELRKRKGELHFLNDYRAGLSCGECKSTKVQALTIVTSDKAGTFTVCVYRCISCDSMWEQAGNIDAFNRYCADDL